MSWPRQGSQKTLENPKFEFKSWISWVWGRACQGKLGGCPPPECFKRILPTPRPPRRCDGLRTATTPRLQEYGFYAAKIAGATVQGINMMKEEFLDSYDGMTMASSWTLWSPQVYLYLWATTTATTTPSANRTSRRVNSSPWLG